MREQKHNTHETKNMNNGTIFAIQNEVESNWDLLFGNPPHCNQPTQ